MTERLKLRIPNVFLRPWHEDDSLSLARYADNTRISAYMRDGFPFPYTREDARRFIMMAGSTTAILRAIEVNGEAAGGIGIHRLDDVYRGTAEIGYWLAEPFWGKGIATEAVRAMVPVAFRLPGIVRIQAGIFANNPASMRVLVKCGFVREAVHRNAITKQGVVMDEVMYVRFREKKDQTGSTRLP